MSKGAFKRMMRERAVPMHRPVPVREPATTYTPPTDEQLANFVATTVTAAAQADGLSIALAPHLADLMLRANPLAKRGWLQRHREFQEAIERESGRAR